jgi:hypothetical protein
MIDGRWGSDWMYGYGFPWLPVLVIGVIVALGDWFVRYRGK